MENENGNKKTYEKENPLTKGKSGSSSRNPLDPRFQREGSGKDYKKENPYVK